MPKHLFTVSELNNLIKDKLDEINDSLDYINLEGEISNFKRHSKGHYYFTIKDQYSSISAIMFSNFTLNLKFTPKDGDKIEVLGKLSLYSPSGSYSLQVMSLKLFGIGNLYQKYEELKAKFQKLGYFDVSHKKVIPTFPKAIGVITSPTGAVIEDIRNTINRRYRLTEIILYRAVVQGPESKNSVASAIKKANIDNLVDVLIIARGGGSVEDLWSFNEEEVVNEIFNSQIPIITAIGHEPDVTIADYVSDKVAPTPTAAAELVTPSTLALLKELDNSQNKIRNLIAEYFKNLKFKLLYLDERLDFLSPFRKLESLKENFFYLVNRLINNYNNLLFRKAALLKAISLKAPVNILFNKEMSLISLKKLLDMNYQYLVSSKEYQLNNTLNQLKDPSEILIKLKERLSKSLNELTNKYFRIITSKKEKYQEYITVIMALNPLKLMDKGYALIYKNQKVVTSVSDIYQEDQLKIRLKDGFLETIVVNKEEVYGK